MIPLLLLPIALSSSPAAARAPAPMPVFTQTWTLEDPSVLRLKSAIRDSLHFRLARRCEQVTGEERTRMIGVDRRVVSYFARTTCQADGMGPFQIEVKQEKFADLTAENKSWGPWVTGLAELEVRCRLPQNIRAAIWGDVDQDEKLDLVQLKELSPGAYALSLSLSGNDRILEFSRLLKARGLGDPHLEQPAEKWVRLSFRDARLNLERGADNGNLHSWTYEIIFDPRSLVVDSVDYLSSTYNHGHGEPNDDSGFRYDFAKHEVEQRNGDEDRETHQIAPSCSVRLEQLDQTGIPACASEVAK